MKIGRELYYNLYNSVLMYKITKAEEDLQFFEKGFNSVKDIIIRLGGK